MAAYYKVDVVLNSQAVQVGLPSPQSVSVTLPLVGPAGPVGSVGPAGPQGPQGVPGTGLEVLTTQGDLLYQGASTGQRLPIGAPSQILKVSAGGIPEWGAAPASGVSSVNGETGTVILDGSDIDTSGNDDLAAFVTYEFSDGNGTYYPLPDSTLNSKRVYRNTTGHHVFFQSLRWHITDGSPITANIIESSDDDNAAWPWLSAWSGDVDKAKIADVIGRARNTFLFVGDSVPSTSVSGLGTAATSDSTAFAAASHTHGNLTNAGAVGTVANLPLRTGTNGVIEAGSFSNTAGSFCAGDDVRLSDARTPSSTLAHKASHATGGTDALSPSDIGAQSIFARSEADVPVSGPLQLSAARAAIVSVRNARSEARDVYLPMTSIQNGDIIVVVGGGTLTNPINIKVPAAGGAAIVDPNGGAVTISVTGQQYRFIVDGVGNFIPWTRVNVDTHTHVVADVTGAAASGSITTSGLTQATARILGRTSSSTGAVEEIQIGSGLSLSAGELSATGSGVTAVGASTADVLSVSGSTLVADDGGLIDSANPFVQWNDTSGKLVYANPLSRPSGAMYVGVPPTTTALGTRAINIQADRSLAASRIASGTDAVMIGNSGEATAANATAIGFRARATGTYSLAIGGEPSATANYSIAIGEAAAASAVSAINISNYSAYFGNNSSGVSSVGLNASPSLRAEFATAAMRAVYWGGQTTSDTANVELNLDATATNRMVIAANTAVIADIFLIARRTDNTKFLAARRWVAIRRDGSNNTALIGGVQTIETDQSEGSPTWTFTIDADDTASVESLRVRVTGAASETVNWRVCAIYRVVA